VVVAVLRSIKPLVLAVLVVAATVHLGQGQQALQTLVVAVAVRSVLVVATLVVLEEVALSFCDIQIHTQLPVVLGLRFPLHLWVQTVWPRLPLAQVQSNLHRCLCSIWLLVVAAVVLAVLLACLALLVMPVKFWLGLRR
jgi:hypothetical protein